MTDIDAWSSVVRYVPPVALVLTAIMIDNVLSTSFRTCLTPLTKGHRATGEFPGLEVHHVAGYFWSLVHGLASLWVDGSMPQYMPQEDIDTVIDAVLVVPGPLAAGRA